MRHLRNLFVCAFLAASASVYALSAIPTGSSCAPVKSEKSPASVVIDSIAWREDLTRVYCRIIGRPHTSDRIDGVEMNVPKRKYIADDIEGVDFKRYFQWEDEDAIELEIDFPAVKEPHSPCNFTFFTVHGEIKASAGK